MSTPPTVLETSSRARNEHAFGVVEVVIAVLLMMAVATGLVLAMSSSTKLRGSARLQAAMTTTGQRMIEHLASDRAWMETCAASMPDTCSITSTINSEDLRRMDDVEGSVVVIDASTPPTTSAADASTSASTSAASPSITAGPADGLATHAVPVDSPVDGVGEDDQDGVVPDHFQITLVIRPEDEVIRRYGGTTERMTRRFTTALDRKGNVLTGSLRVDACVARNQVDERMSIDGCDNDGLTNVKMDDCPLAPPSGMASYFTNCQPTYNWVGARAAPTDITLPSPFVALERIPTSRYEFRIVNTSTGNSTDSDEARQVDGSYVFEELEAGSYRIEGLPTSMTIGGVVHQRWRTKELPAWHDDPENHDGSVGVQPGVKNHALVMFRVPRTEHGLRFRLDRQVQVRPLNLQPVHTEYTNGPQPWDGREWMNTDTYDGSKALEFCNDYLEFDSSSWQEDYDGEPDFEVEDDGNGEGQVYYDLDIDENARNRMSFRCSVANHIFPSCKYLRYSKFWWAYRREPIGPDDDGPNPWTVDDWYSQRGSISFCTFYRNELHHTYYAAGVPATPIRRGAYRSAVYEVSPRPTLREMRYGGPHGMRLSDASIVRKTCIVRGHTTLPRGVAYSPSSETASEGCIGGSNIHQLHPGLNTRVVAPADGVVSGAAISDSASPGFGQPNTNPVQAGLNATRIGLPSWAAGAGLWVRPDGGITGGDESDRGHDPEIHLRGNGECYWSRGPGGSDAEYEGSCDPCRPYVRIDNRNANGCGVLTRTCTDRYVLELSAQAEYHYRNASGRTRDEGAEAWEEEHREGPIRVLPASGGDCQQYSPTWECPSIPATILNGNCGPPAPAPPPGLRGTETEMSAGTAYVAPQPITTGRSGY